MESINKDALVFAVCPIQRFGNYFVTASGIGNKESENFITIYQFDTKSAQNPLKILSKVKVSVPFNSISWTTYGEDTEDHSFGFIVGGHHDGSISLWAPTFIISNTENKKINFGLIQSKKFHNGPVNAIKFNQKPSLFATGSKDIVIVSIEKNLTLESPVKCPSQDDAEITSLCWNDKVSHILASATTTGVTYIWEMKKSEVFIKIVDQNLISEDEDIKQESINTNLLWCADGVQILISYDYPDYAFMTQYHMKQPNAPIAEYCGGHREPIIQMVKNPNDNNFMLSLGKDDQVTLWSLRTQKHHAVMVMNEKVTSIQWLYKTPDVFISVSVEGNVQYHQVNFSTESLNKNEISNELPPKWMCRKSGVSFAFGGQLASFNEKSASNVSIHSIRGDQELSTKMKTFIEKLEKDLNQVLDEKINLNISNNSREKNASLFWVALKCINSDNYSELFKAMGFDKTKLQNEVYSYIGKKVEKTQKKERTKVNNINLAAFNDEKEAEKFWSEAISKNEKEEEKIGASVKNSESSLINEKPLTIQETVTKNINWNLGAEKLIKQSLLIGDLESAVDVALKCGRDAEALLIASAGDKELFNKAKQSFFNKNKDLFIKNIFSSIVNGNFESLFEYNVLKDWKEYILYAKTYLNANEFLNFANNLGDRLSSNPDIYMALICYILGRNYEKCVNLLYNNFIKETEKISKNEKKIYIHHLFEQVILIKNILGFNQTNEKTDKIISDYCELLISEGLFVEALGFMIKIKIHNIKILTLYDRIYNHSENKLGNKPSKMQAPFNIINVKPKLEKKVIQNTSSNQGKVGAKLPQTNRDIFDTISSNQNQSIGQTKRPSFGEQENKVSRENVNETSKIPKPVHPFGMNKSVTSNEPQRQEPTKGGYINPNQEMPENVKKPVAPFKPINPPMPNIMKKINEDNNVSSNAPNFNNRATNQIQGSMPLNPPKPIFGNSNIKPPVSNPSIGKNDSSNNLNKIASPVSSNSSQSNQPSMSADEEFVYNSFEKFVSIYNNVFAEENKQKDFYNRVSSLFGKLKNKEIKPNLLRLLIDFIKLFNEEGSSSDLKKIQLKIQACGWDQNKTWMSCIDKIVNLPKK